MGKAIGITCPFCGAPLHYTDSYVIKCEFCGCSVSLNPEQKNSFGKETSSQKVAKRLALSKSLEELVDPVNDVNAYTEYASNMQNEISHKEYLLQQLNRSFNKKRLLIPLVIFILSYLPLGTIRLPFLFTAITFGVLYLSIHLKRKKLESSISELSAKYKETEDYIESLYSTYNFDLVPKSYQYQEAIFLFSQYIECGRASSVQEAINVYEDEKHKERLIQLKEEENEIQARQLELQQRQLEEQRRTSEQQLELARKKNENDIDWGSVAATVGGVALATLALRKKRK